MYVYTQLNKVNLRVKSDNFLRHGLEQYIPKYTTSIT
jgi:hypothetical protein